MNLSVLPIFICLISAVALSAATRYVNLNNSQPVPPYASWNTAATNIQNAVDAALPGDLILVTNGVYRTGGRSTPSGLLSRVTVDKFLNLRSVNGPGATLIDGSGARCIFLSHSTSLTGFTLTNGRTGFVGDGSVELRTAAGAYCESPTAVLSNCVIINNWSAQHAGGVFNGTLYNCLVRSNYAYVSGGGLYGCIAIDCVLTNNRAYEAAGAHHSFLTNCLVTHNRADQRVGAALSSTLDNCLIVSNTAVIGIGGGVWLGTLNRCVLLGNAAIGQQAQGGGAVGATLYNCLLRGNYAYFGGGANASTLFHCTVLENSAQFGGGVSRSFVTNSIVLSNAASADANYDAYESRIGHSCTTPLPLGVGNLTNDPGFISWAGGNFRLQSNAPCINAGTNLSSAGAFDLDGRNRTVGSMVDIGAYEHQSSETNAYMAWLQQFGLSANRSTDAVDTDEDGAGSWQEWRAGTNPTNALSILKLHMPQFTGSNVALCWPGMSNRTYFVERRQGLQGSPVIIASTNSGNNEAILLHSDTPPGDGQPVFYRVIVP